MNGQPRPAQTPLVWERPEPPARPTPTPLSRERIVRAAIGIADAEGLAAVSLRKVAAALDAGPMRLYGYVSAKDELLELMVDAVYGEMASARPAGEDWRAALTSDAGRTRAAANRHPWFIQLLSGRPHLGPNALEHLEASLAALTRAPGFEDIDAAMLAYLTVNAYVVGALQLQASELRAEADSGMNESEWQTSTAPYIFRVIETGRFPCLAAVVRDATSPSPDVWFDQGLDRVLDGIAAGARGDG
jgi:AcrR family transcriptional regulator